MIAIRSTTFAQSNLVYCFRLTNAGSLTNSVFTVQPQATLNPNPRPQHGGTGSEPNGGAVARGGGGQNGGATSTDNNGAGVPHGGGGQGGGGGDSG